MYSISKLLIAGAVIAGSQTFTAPKAAAQEAFMGEVREFGFNFCPRGWAKAEGQLISVNENQALFSLLGTTYGGDGRTTFKLPDYSTEAASSQPAPATSGEVKIYQHCNYEGWNQSVGLGKYKDGEFGRNASFKDNDASSIKISAGWEVVLHDGANFDGRSVTLSGDESCLVGHSFNDVLSSIEVRRKGAAAPVAQSAGPEGVTTCIAMTGIYPSRN